METNGVQMYKYNFGNPWLANQRREECGGDFEAQLELAKQERDTMTAEDYNQGFIIPDGYSSPPEMWRLVEPPPASLQMGQLAPFATDSALEAALWKLTNAYTEPEDFEKLRGYLLSQQTSEHEFSGMDVIGFAEEFKYRMGHYAELVQSGRSPDVPFLDMLIDAADMGVSFDQVCATIDEEIRAGMRTETTERPSDEGGLFAMFMQNLYEQNKSAMEELLLGVEELHKITEAEQQQRNAQIRR